MIDIMVITFVIAVGVVVIPSPTAVGASIVVDVRASKDAET